MTDPTCLLWTVCIYWYWMNCWQAKYLPFAHCFCTTSIMYSCVLNDHILTYILCKWKWDCTENYFKNKYSHEIYVHVVAGLCVCVCVWVRERHTHTRTHIVRETENVCVGERDTEKVTNLVFYAQSTVSYIGAMRETHSLSACLSHTQCVCVCVWERQTENVCVREMENVCMRDRVCVQS